LRDERENAAAAASAAAARRAPPGGWACGDCTLVNAASERTCGACGLHVETFDPARPPGAAADWRGALAPAELEARLRHFVAQARGGGGRTAPRRAGIANLGNTCFMAAGLQALLAVEPLRAIFEAPSFARGGGVRQTHSQGYAGDLALAWAGLVAAHGEGAAPLQARALRAVVGRMGHLGREFANGAQHDAGSFMQNLLDGLFEDTRYAAEGAGRDWAHVRFPTRRRVTPRSPVRDLFGCTHLERFSCEGACRKDSRVFLTMVTLPIPEPRGGGGGGARAVSLLDCVSSFYTRVHPFEKAPCDVCGRATARTRRVFLEALPGALVFALQRYTPDGRKLNGPVKIPLRIEGLAATGALAEGQEDAAYDLCAVTLHSGSRAGGHYTAAVRGGEGWLLCDDSRVSPAPGFERDMDTGLVGFFTVTACVYVKSGAPPPPPPQAGSEQPG